MEIVKKAARIKYSGPVRPITDSPTYLQKAHNSVLETLIPSQGWKNLVIQVCIVILSFEFMLVFRDDITLPSLVQCTPSLIFEIT